MNYNKYIATVSVLASLALFAACKSKTPTPSVSDTATVEVPAWMNEDQASHYAGAMSGNHEEMLLLGDALAADAPEEAIIWYGRSAELGNIEAARRIADCFAQGKGIKQSDSMAAVWTARVETMKKK